MREHLLPYRPVMRPVRPDIEPVTDILMGQQPAQQFILSPAAVPVRRAEHDPHIPEIGVIRMRYEIHRVGKINIVIIISIHERTDIEIAAHREAMAADRRVTEGEIHRVISSETAPGDGYPGIARFRTGPRTDLLYQEPVIKSMVIGALPG